MMDFEIWVAIALFVILVSVPGWAALYIARRRESVTTYASMEATIRALSDQVRQMHGEISRLQNKVAELTLGVRVLSGQLMDLGQSPEFTPSDPAPAAEPLATDPASLYNHLVKEFNLDEISDLAFRMGIETGELGEETISGRARALISYTRRRGKLDKLAAMMNTMRPP